MTAGAAARGVGTGRLLGAAALLGVAAVTVPLATLTARMPWRDLPAVLADPATLAALRVSVVTSTVALALSAALGVPVAWVLARAEFPGRAVVRALVTLPMVLPPVVAGVALLAAFGPRGPLGAALARLGVTLPFTPAAAVLAQAFVAAPFLVVATEAGFARVDRRLEDAGATLGAGRWQLWRAVILPAVRPSLAAGAALCWARALGEFGATVAFAGSLRGSTQTLPLAVYERLQTQPDAALALSVVLLAVSFGLIVGLQARLTGPVR